MPIDLSSFGESLQRSLGAIPPVAIALALLAGPTLLLIGYRLFGVARRMRSSDEVTSVALWVCHECRSVNELRHSRCYRCGTERDATEEIEVIVDRPTGAPASFDVPAGSPFAAIAANPHQRAAQGPGVPVMGDSSVASDAIAVGPGLPVDAPVGSTADVEAMAPPEAAVPGPGRAQSQRRRPR